MSVLPDPTMALSVRSLKKTYRSSGPVPDKEALKGIDLDIPKGSIFGLLGPNGAGKSTMINIIAGLVTKTSGQILIDGIDMDRNPRRAKRAVGVVPQEINVDFFFSPRETLDIMAGLFGVPETKRVTDELLEKVGLTDKANAYARALSGGMKRRLLVAKALVHKPGVVILDEPTAGVDVELRQRLWEYMQELNAQGTTVILTTHYLEEAQSMCEQIAILNHGAVVACDRTEQLISRIDEKKLTVRVSNDLPDVLPVSLSDAGFMRQDTSRLSVTYQPSQAQVGELLDQVRSANLTIVDLETDQGDLEDVFVRLTQDQIQ